jgi:hypothetical protein
MPHLLIAGYIAVIICAWSRNVHAAQNNVPDTYLSRLLDNPVCAYVAAGSLIVAGGAYTYWLRNVTDAKKAQELEARGLGWLQNVGCLGMIEYHSGYDKPIGRNTGTFSIGDHMAYHPLDSKKDRQILEQTMTQGWNRITVERLGSEAFITTVQRGLDWIPPVVASRAQGAAEVTLQYPKDTHIITVTAEEYVQLGRLYHVSKAAHVSGWIVNHMHGHIQKAFDNEYRTSCQWIKAQGVSAGRCAQVCGHLLEQKRKLQAKYITDHQRLIDFARVHQDTALQLAREILVNLGDKPTIKDIYLHCPGIIYDPDLYPQKGYTPFTRSEKSPWLAPEW